MSFGLPADLLGMLAAPAGAGFEEFYRCYSVAMAGRLDLEEGGKVLMPQSALTRLTQMHVQYPMQFKVTNPGGGAGGRATHCGVQEFSAEEGRLYMPHWMMQSLLLEEGAMVVVRNVQLPKARFVKLRPHSSAFLDVSNPRAMLETKLRHFSAMTVGDIIVVRYADHDFYFDVLEAKPTTAVSVVETDMEVDFAPPRDYKEPAPVGKGAGSSSSAAAASSSSSAAGTRGKGTAASPITFADDDDDVQIVDGGGAGAAKGSSAATGVGAAASSSAPAGLAPISAGGRATSAAGAAALARLAGGSGSGTPGSDGGAAPSKFAPRNNFQAFTGVGRRLGGDGPGGSGGTPAASGGTPSASASGATPKSPSLTPLAGGVVLSAGGAGGGSAKPQRSLNRFEQARAEKAFQGEGRSLKG